MWPQRWLGELFSALYTRYGHDCFVLDAIVSLVRSEAKARVAASRLKKAGLLYVFGVADRRRQYLVADPILLPHLATGRLSNLQLVRQSRYARLIGLFSVEAVDAAPMIRSVVLYGSVSRGVANSGSDVDLLILMDSEKSVGERIQQVSQVEDSGRTSRELDWLDDHGIHTHISILPLTVDEAMRFPPVLLDILEDGIAVVDDGTFSDLRTRLHSRLVEAGARREFLSPNEWYWDLAPGLKAGEVYAL